jgi:hypothetical protein
MLHTDPPSPPSSDEFHDALSIADMRREILFGSRHSRLVQDCLEAAEERDLPEEEMYVWLAYQALLRLEEFHRMCTCPRIARPASPDAIDGHF